MQVSFQLHFPYSLVLRFFWGGRGLSIRGFFAIRGLVGLQIRMRKFLFMEQFRSSVFVYTFLGLKGERPILRTCSYLRDKNIDRRKKASANKGLQVGPADGAEVCPLKKGIIFFGKWEHRDLIHWGILRLFFGGKGYCLGVGGLRTKQKGYDRPRFLELIGFTRARFF